MKKNQGQKNVKPHLFWYTQFRFYNQVGEGGGKVSGSPFFPKSYVEVFFSAIKWAKYKV